MLVKKRLVKDATNSGATALDVQCLGEYVLSSLFCPATCIKFDTSHLQSELIFLIIEMQRMLRAQSQLNQGCFGCAGFLKHEIDLK